MRVIETSVYVGPHLFSAFPMVRLMVDLGELEEHPTNRLAGFSDALIAVLPGVNVHHCSRGHPGGFLERLDEGTWMGHVVEHVALELQKLAGMPVNRGKTRAVHGRRGVYNVLYAYQDPEVGLAAGCVALQLVSSLLPPEHRPLELGPLAGRAPAQAGEPIPGFSALAKLANRRRLGPTTQSLVDAARRRGIPVHRIDGGSLLRLGWGSRQRMLGASITSATSHLAVQLAGDKQRTRTALQAAGVPVPRGSVVRSPDEAVGAATRLGVPVVTKPLNGNHGRGVSVGLIGEDAVRQGFEEATRHSPRVIVEQQLIGRDYRGLVVGGHLVAIAERVPARVVGDGSRTVAELVEAVNADPRRGVGHGNFLTRILLDETVDRLLAAQGLARDAIPPSGTKVWLRETANLSSGGEAIDRTDDAHPDTVALLERAAGTIGLDVAGIDLITPDISRPIREMGGGVVEVNAAPGFRMHLAPSGGEPRDVGGAVIDMLYPKGSRARIPVVAITGTNGKSTTVRMLAHILQRSGRRTGMTTTSGVYLDGRLVKKGDASGPRSARMLLNDPTVDAAVLETARGGILREGLGMDRVDVGIVLNVTADHLGLAGIDTLEQLAQVKSVVVRSVARRGLSVLNADDPITVRLRDVARGRAGYFTMRPLTERLRSCLAEGGLVAAKEDDGTLVVLDGDTRIPLLHASEIPATLDGAAGFNIQNALAAAAAAFVLGVAPGSIAASLREFSGSFEQNPGRLNVTDAPGFTTIVDYAHNPAAIAALGEALEGLRTEHDRLIGVVSTPGDRRDVDIREVGRLAAGIFDVLVFRELPDGRGRRPGDVVRLLRGGAAAGGATDERIHVVLDELAAMQYALEMAGPFDLVVLMPSDVEGVWQQVHAFGRSRVARDEEEGAHATT
jgi:cyanophycin synthetase